MIRIVDKKDCCGCGACYSACPRQCITMKEDNEGFLYPVVDRTKCIQCGLCKKVCPILNYTKPHDCVKEAAVVQNKDKNILRESTSGGFFTEIARYVIEKGGVVFGAYIGDDHRVKHVYVNSVNELFRFRNSKYVQSSIGETFKEAKKFLENGVLVCYSGTPCQVYALKQFLGKDYINLIMVDVVCRAVPSPGVWGRYIRAKEKRLGHLKSIRFRDKSLGYQYSTMCIESDYGKIERGGIESDQWLRMFFSGMIIRPSCTTCVFRNYERVSDYTIWDCFNIRNIDRSLNEDIGTTRLLIHTNKGLSIINEIKSSFVYRKIPFNKAIKGCKEFSVSPQFHDLRKEFFRDYKRMDMNDLLNKYFPLSFTVRIKKMARILLNKIGMDKKIKHMLKKG